MSWKVLVRHRRWQPRTSRFRANEWHHLIGNIPMHSVYSVGSDRRACASLCAKRLTANLIPLEASSYHGVFRVFCSQTNIVAYQPRDVCDRCPTTLQPPNTSRKCVGAPHNHPPRYGTNTRLRSPIRLDVTQVRLVLPSVSGYF